MPSWWYSLDTISTISTVSNLAIALLGLWVFIIGWQLSKLQEQATIRENSVRDEKISNSNERAAKLENEAAQAKLELAKIKEKQAFRTLSAAQKTALKALLVNSPKGKINVWRTLGSQESESFSKEIANAFRDSGFEVDDRGWQQFGVSGIQVGVQDVVAPPNHTTFLFEALKAIGLNPTADKSPTDPGSVVIIVGEKPDSGM